MRTVQLDPTPGIERRTGLQFLGQPVGAGTIGTAPTASFTPVGPRATPVPFTPVPGTLSIPINDQTIVTPPPQRAVSLAEAPPLPRSWSKIAVVVVLLAIIAALALKVITTDENAAPSQPTKSTSTPKATKPASEPAKTVARPAQPDPAPPPILPLNDSAELKSLLQALEKGKTCTDRKKAVGGLLALGDKDAVPALKKARYRMRGGLLGIGSSNANHCLKADAEAAITALGGTFK